MDPVVVDAKLLYYDLKECGWKYSLVGEHCYQTSLRPPVDCKYTDARGETWVELFVNGIIWFKDEYAYDGASGPTMDTKSSMRGALIHDGLYQLMGCGALPESFRAQADDELKRWCKRDGMWWWRAGLWHWAVDSFAGSSAKKGRKDPVRWKVRMAP